MASNAATDEFNALVSNSNTAHRTSHPADVDADANAVSSDDGSTTIAASSGPSVRSSTSHSLKPTKPSLTSNSRGRPVSFLHDSSDSDGENEAPGASNRRPGAPSKYYLPSTYQKGAMTGPKGVIADAKAFEREKRGKKSSDFKRTMDLALPRSQSYGGKSPTPDRRGNPRSGSEDVEEDSGSDDDGSDDAEALRKWREKRTGEIKGSIGKTRERHWGTLENVTGLQFLEAVEKAGRGAIVLVYIFDDEQTISDAFVPHIANLADKHSTIRFIALHHLDAGIDSAGVPAILAYRDSDKFADILPLAAEVDVYGGDCEGDLEAAFRSRGILH